MKRRPAIQQFEMSFAADNFNLAGEVTADGARIQAEREQSARDRAESEARQTSIAGIGCEECGAANGYTCGCASWDYENDPRETNEPKRIPGLAPGSSWTVDRGMTKALATMQKV